jgi:3',5'-nucleoside bisphosphate phosphatase
VLAHPKFLKLDDDPAKLEAACEKLRDDGLDGIEAYSSCQTPEQARRYSQIGKRLSLLVTGGSDFHGENKPGIALGWAGDGASVLYETVDEMKRRILERKRGESS